MGGGEDDISGEEASNITKQKVAAAKKYIENHYKEQMKNLQERKERYLKVLVKLHNLVFSFFFYHCKVLEHQSSK